MPYQNEKQNYKNQRDLIDDEFIKTVSKFNVGKEREDDNIEIEVSNVRDDDDNLPEYIYSIDGTRIEPEFRNNARFGAINISVVRTDVNKLGNLSGNSTINPAELEKCYEVDKIGFPLPSSGIYMNDKNPRDSWREIIYDVISKKSVFDFNLKRGYREIIRNVTPVGEDFTMKDICTSCKKRSNIKIDVSNFEQLNFACEECDKVIYPTDRIGVPSRVNSRNSNIDNMRALMNILEHIVVFSIHQGVDSKSCILKDGPLASFDGGGWIARSMKKSLRSNKSTEPLILGIQKSGDFSIFAEKIRDKYPQNSIIELSPEYIEANIKSERSVEGIYGEETYYGKNFIFKNRSGYILPFNIPRKFGDDGQLLYKKEDYSRINMATSIMNNLEMSMYGDSLIPVHRAHDEATISEKFGEKILSKIGLSEINENNLT
jgi:hypothetical protein